jgi:hypothetical protein
MLQPLESGSVVTWTVAGRRFSRTLHGPFPVIGSLDLGLWTNFADPSEYSERSSDADAAPPFLPFPSVEGLQHPLEFATSSELTPLSGGPNHTRRVNLLPANFVKNEAANRFLDKIPHFLRGDHRSAA